MRWCNSIVSPMIFAARMSFAREQLSSSRSESILSKYGSWKDLTKGAMDFINFLGSANDVFTSRSVFLQSRQSIHLEWCWMAKFVWIVRIVAGALRWFSCSLIKYVIFYSSRELSDKSLSFSTLSTVGTMCCWEWGGQAEESHSISEGYRLVLLTNWCHYAQGWSHRAVWSADLGH